MWQNVYSYSPKKQQFKYGTDVEIRRSKPCSFMQIGIIEQKTAPYREETVGALSLKEVAHYQHAISNEWKLINGKKIRRKFEFRDYLTNVNFLTQIAELAESEKCYPEMFNTNKTLEVTLWSHEIEGLSEKDFLLASKIDEMAFQY